MFRFERTEQGGITVLTLTGSLDGLASPALRQEVTAIEGARRLRVAVDMTHVMLVDSAGIGLLASLCERLRVYGGAVHFAGLHGQPEELFRLLRLDRTLDLHPTLAGAVAKLKG